MAEIKKNVVGTKKAMLDFALYNGRCANDRCGIKLNFDEFQLDHITPRIEYINNGQAINHRLSNLAPLCKSCNSTKQDMGIEFYSENVQAFMASIAKWENSASNPNDIRTILAKPHKGFYGGKVNKQVMNLLCDNYAKANPSSKFARIHRQGKFYRKAD